jgi:hypothetical protein
MPSRDPLPSFIEPQLSLLVKAPPAGPEWTHELKYDGYRIHARLERGRARLLTRTGLDWTDRYATTAEAMSAISARSAYLDGELCAVRADGTTAFAELQAATDHRRTTNLVYFVFDDRPRPWSAILQGRVDDLRRGFPHRVRSSPVQHNVSKTDQAIGTRSSNGWPSPPTPSSERVPSHRGSRAPPRQESPGHPLESRPSAGVLDAPSLRHTCSEIGSRSRR